MVELFLFFHIPAERKLFAIHCVVLSLFRTTYNAVSDMHAWFWKRENFRKILYFPKANREILNVLRRDYVPHGKPMHTRRPWAHRKPFGISRFLAINRNLSICGKTLRHGLILVIKSIPLYSLLLLCHTIKGQYA
jgi:hypothetical protein